jgi:hypothetical protein
MSPNGDSWNRFLVLGAVDQFFLDVLENLGAGDVDVGRVRAGQLDLELAAVGQRQELVLERGLRDQVAELDPIPTTSSNNAPNSLARF